MIQATKDWKEAHTLNYINVNIAGEMTSFDYKPLVYLVNQQTGADYGFIPTQINDVTYPSYDYTINEGRYTKMTYRILKDCSGENPVAGHICLGVTYNATYQNLPYGMYNMTIYQNNSNSNLQPENAIKKLWTGLYNLTAVNNNAVTYTEYTTNDADTESIYLTNPL
tara:strand:+ start:968 stop:1468 length:501 start_codon:yes stop_codon:yes gene_type:complete